MDIMGEVDKVLRERNSQKTTAKVVKQQKLFSLEEIVIELSTPDSEFNNMMGIVVHRDGDGKVTGVRVDGMGTAEHWADVLKVIKAL